MNGTPPRFQSYLKSLILLGFLTIGISQVWGGTIELDATKDKTFPKDGISLSVTDGTLTNGTDYRVYKNKTLTITSTVGNITNIALTYSSSSNDGGGWASSYQPNAASWTSPTANGEQARITKIVVTIASPGDDDDPCGDVGTVKAGTYNFTPNDEFWGVTGYNGSKTVQANKFSVSAADNGICMRLANGSSANSYINTSHTRAYNGYSMKFTVPENYLITGITFTDNGSSTWSGSNNSASSGSLSSDKKSWSGSAQEVTITFGGTCQMTKVSVTYSGGDAPSCTDLTTPSDLNVSNVTINGATLSWTGDDNASSYTVMIGETEYKNVTSPYAVSGLEAETQYTWSVQAIGDGETYCSSAVVDGTPFTTLADPSKKKLNFDFTYQVSGWPSSSSANNYTYTLNSVAYTFALTSNVYINTYQNASYLMVKENAALGLPAIQGYKLTKVVANNSSGCSTSTSVSIRTGNTSTASLVTGGTAQTWSTKSSSYTYTLSNTAANTMYYIYAASANCQIINLQLTYERVELPKVAVTLASNPAAAVTEWMVLDDQAELVTNLDQIEQGTELTIEATYSSDNYKFINWTLSDDNGGASLDNSTSSTPTLTVGSKPVTITANFDTYYAVTVSQPTGATLSAKISDVDVTKALNKDEIIVSYQLTDGYVFKDWVITNTSTSADVTASVLSGTTLTMPAYAITISANVAEKTGEDLPTPTGLGIVDGSIKSYGATLKWNEVDNASKYEVYITDLDQYEQTYSDVATTEYIGYTITGLKANTTYYWTVKAIGDGENYYDSPSSDDADFTTTAPVLSSIAVTSNPTILKYKIGDTFNPAGLKINTIYDDASEAEVDYGDETKGDFSFTEIDFTQEGNTAVSVTYKGITAAETFEVSVVDKVMITWMVGDEPYCAATEATEDGKVGALPAGTPESPCPTHYPYFVGWTRYEYSGGVPDEPTLLSPTSTAENSFTAHAVFAKTRTLSGFEKMDDDQFDSNALYAIGAKESGGSGAAIHYFSGYTDANLPDNTSAESWGQHSTEKANAVVFQLIQSQYGNTPVDKDQYGTFVSAKDSRGNYFVPLTDNKCKMSNTAKTIKLYSSNGTIVNPANTSWALRYNHNNGSGGFRWYNGSTGTQAQFYKATYNYSGLIITCPETYSATVANEIEGGSVQISLDGANWTNEITDQEKDTKIYLSNSANEGYTFNKYVVTKDNEHQTEVTVTDNAFDIKDANVNVSAQFDKISVTNASIVVEGGDAAKTLSLGKTLNLSLDILPTTARPTIVWSSSDEGVVTVAATDATPWAGCVVTPVAEGSATVKAKVDNLDRSVTITVIAATVLDHLTLENVHTEYTLGDEFVKPKVTAYYVYEGGESASHKVVTDDVVVTGYDKNTATMGDAKQKVTLTYTDGVSVSREIDVTVAPWKLNLKARHLTGNNVEEEVTNPIDVIKLNQEIDLTAHYATLCDEYQQIGYIKSATEVSEKPADADLLTSYAPTSNNETLYGVYKKVGYEGETFIENALSAVPTGWTASGTVDAVTAASESCLKFGSNGSPASITSSEFAVKGHKVKVALDALRYDNKDDASAEACVTIGGVTKSSGTLSTTQWKSFEFEFDIQANNSTVKIGTLNNGKRRCYIKNLKVYSEPEVEYTSVYDCRQPMDIIYNLNDGGTDEATCGATNTTALEGTSYTIYGTAPAWLGHNFLGWQVNDDAVNLKAAGASITINEATTLTAQWKEIVPENIVFNNNAITIDNGVTSSVTATITPTTAYLKTITWSQSSEDGGLLELAQTTSTTGTDFSFKALNPGTVTLTATAGTIERQVVVTINKVMALTQLEATNEHRTFKIGETFVKETITAIYSDGSQSESREITQASVNFSTPDMQTSGVKTIEVSYQDPNTLVSANMTYEITVTPWTLNVYSSPEKKQAMEITTLKEATTIPACQAAAGNVFLGYSTSLESTEVTVTNSYLPTADNENLYAVYQNGQYVLVTNVNQLINDHKVVIAASGSEYGLGEQKRSNRDAVSITKSEDGTCLTSLGNAYELTLGVVGTNYTFYDETNSGYLYNSSTSSNELKNRTNIGDDNKAKWTISVTNAGVATITNVADNDRVLRFNDQSILFACYKGTQKEVALYTSPTGMTRSHSNVIYVTSETELNATTATGNPDIIIANTGVVTLTEDVTIGNLTINVTQSNSGQIKGNAAITITGEASMQLEIDPATEASQGWYAFAVPFPVDALNGVYYNDTKLTNEVGYAIMDYHGDVRAQGQYGWKKYRGILQPGVFYYITLGDTDYKNLCFRLKKDGDTYTLQNNYSVDYTAYPSANLQDAGYNGVANKTLENVKIQKTEHMSDIVYTYDNANKVFAPTDLDVDDPTFLPTQPFFVTVNANGSFNLSAQPAPATAPRWMTEDEVQTMSKVKVTLANNSYTDNYYVSASTEAKNEFEQLKDAVKMGTIDNSTKVPQIASVNYNNTILSAEYAQLVGGQAFINLLLYAPANGEYTIAATECKDGEIYLTQNGENIWNLKDTYTVTLTKGKTYEYGLRLVASAQAPTGSETINATNEAQKVIKEGNFYILQNGNVYSAQGQLLK